MDTDILIVLAFVHCLKDENLEPYKFFSLSLKEVLFRTLQQCFLSEMVLT